MKNFIFAGLFLMLTGFDAQAFTVDIKHGGRMVYLRVGDGAFNGLYTSDGTPQNSSIVNLVSVAVPAGSLGSGTPLAMTSNATQTTSYYDGHAFCNLPQEVYIGGFVRKQNNSPVNGVLTVAAPAQLMDSDGDSIPFSDISWVSSGNGDGNEAQPFPSGAFAGGSQTLATFPGNTWRESCHRFFYKNANFVAAGVYQGRVVYTLSVP